MHEYGGSNKREWCRLAERNEQWNLEYNETAELALLCDARESGRGTVWSRGPTKKCAGVVTS